MKVCVLGCGLRTPLLVHGLVHGGLGIREIALYDNRPPAAALMGSLCSAIADGTTTRITTPASADDAIADSSFVISSIRVGNMGARARDERLSLECGFAGQETTGPAGFAMALRTIPVALDYARTVERIAAAAWFINFTNPAGIITQAISTHTNAKVVGICDTPAELFHQIARALEEALEDVECDYFGLNHLGWVRAVRVRGEDVTSKLLADDELLRRLYRAELFPPALIRGLGLIPTEYLFFYYNQSLATANQRRAGVTRGEELARLNGQVWAELEELTRKNEANSALAAYRRYLNRRNASYMKLEGEGGSAFAGPDPDWDPFEGATGYHRIAVDSIAALSGLRPRVLILNVPNGGAVEGIGSADVVETPCFVDHTGPRPLAVGLPPESVRGLMLSVKQYERLTVDAAVLSSREMANLALMTNPIVGSWDAARDFLDRYPARDILRGAVGYQ